MNGADVPLAIAAVWFLVPTVPIALDCVDRWRDQRLSEIRQAEELADRAFDRAIAAVRLDQAAR